MASSLRCYRPVSRVDAIAASKAPQSFRLRNAPLALVDVAVAIRVHLDERRLEARRDEEVLEVRVAAVDEEAYHDLSRKRSVKRSFGCSFVCVCVRSRCDRVFGVVVVQNHRSFLST